MPDSDTPKAENGTLQRRLQLALDAASMGTWEWDPFTGHTIWDSCMFELTGLPREIGHTAASSLFAIIPAEDRERLEASVNEIISGGVDAQKIDFRIRRPDTGQIRWITSKAGIQNINGDVKLVGVMYDVTDKHDAVKEVQTANKAKDQFIAMIAHELRAPLFPITLNVELMTRKINDPVAILAGLDVIRRQTTQIKRLVDDLLDLSRVTSNRITLRHERVDASEVLREAIECSMHLISKRGHRLIVQSPVEAVFFDADKQRVIQVLTNLIQNAAKYTPDHGAITLNVRGDEHNVAFKIIDTGPGIPHHLKYTIFDLFYQVKKDATRSEGGLGIGLALVKNLVDLHGGSVIITDNEPTGSVFTVTLPRAIRKTD